MHALRLLLSLLPTLVLAGGVPQTHGVHPSLLSKYEPKGTTWTCLDGVKTIPWTAVNDDYCDCLDGSDEPGASLFFVILSRPYKPNQERVRV
jgi:protein kinase C substrate 80K-H